MGGAFFNSTHVAPDSRKNQQESPKNSRTDTKKQKKTVIETKIENFQSIFFILLGKPDGLGVKMAALNCSATGFTSVRGLCCMSLPFLLFYVSCHLSSTLSRNRPNIIHQNVFSWHFWDTLNWHIQCSLYFKVHSLKKKRFWVQMNVSNVVLQLVCHIFFFFTVYIIVLLRINNYYH